jgi:ribosomal protein L7Ae-like RNA K-turn-binding protein
LHLAPWNAAVWDTYAAVVFGLKDCNEAIAAQKRALQLLTENVSQKAVAPYLAKLEEYTGCLTSGVAKQGDQ